MSTHTVKIIPAILPQTKADMFEMFARVERLPLADKLVHLDVADGIFVPFTTYPLAHGDTLTEVDCIPHGTFERGLHFSVHFMVAHPERIVPVYLKAGAAEVIIHIESFASLELLEACCAMWNMQNVRIVLASLMSTPVQRLVDCMEVTRIHRVLLMSIAHAGQQGSPFDRFVLTHIHELLRLYPSARITVDGGLNAETITEVLSAGVERCVVGSHLLHAKNIEEAYERLVRMGANV
jgi:ribulose-phosphate 3-epimerase